MRKKDRYETRDALLLEVRQLRARGLPVKISELGDKYKTNHSTVRGWVREAGMVMRKGIKEFAKMKVLQEAIAICEEGEAPDVDLLAKAYEVSPQDVRKWLREAKLIPDARTKDQTKAALLFEARMTDGQVKVAELAKKYEVDLKTARKWLKEADIDLDSTPGKVPFGYDNHEVRDAILRQCARVFAAGGAKEVHPDLFVTNYASKAAITRWLIEAGYGPFPKQHNADWAMGYEYHPDSPYIAANKDKY